MPAAFGGVAFVSSSRWPTSGGTIFDWEPWLAPAATWAAAGTWLALVGLRLATRGRRGPHPVALLLVLNVFVVGFVLAAVFAFSSWHRVERWTQTATSDLVARDGTVYRAFGRGWLEGGSMIARREFEGWGWSRHRVLVTGTLGDGWALVVPAGADRSGPLVEGNGCVFLLWGKGLGGIGVTVEGKPIVGQGPEGERSETTFSHRMPSVFRLIGPDDGIDEESLLAVEERISSAARGRGPYAILGDDDLEAALGSPNAAIRHAAARFVSAGGSDVYPGAWNALASAPGPPGTSPAAAAAGLRVHALQVTPPPAGAVAGEIAFVVENESGEDVPRRRTGAARPVEVLRARFTTLGITCVPVPSEGHMLDSPLAAGGRETLRSVVVRLRDERPVRVRGTVVVRDAEDRISVIATAPVTLDAAAWPKAQPLHEDDLARICASGAGVRVVFGVAGTFAGSNLLDVREDGTATVCVSRTGKGSRGTPGVHTVRLADAEVAALRGALAVAPIDACQPWSFHAPSAADDPDVRLLLVSGTRAALVEGRWRELEGHGLGPLLEHLRELSRRLASR